MTHLNSQNKPIIRLPWGAWYADSDFTLELPENSDITFFNLPRFPSLSEQLTRRKLAACIPLVKRKNPQSIVIVVDDLTRPVYLGEMLNILVRTLHECGVPKNAIRFLVGLGTHRPLTVQDMAKKLGSDIVQEYECLNHDLADTIPIDVVWGKTPVKLNRHYVQADFKIVISGLTPHSFAGFSGGAKMLIPGLADMEIVAKTHKSVMMGFMGKLGEVQNNRFRKTIEALVEHVGLDFFIGVVLNGDRTIADIYAGDYVEAHRQAAFKARKLYEVSLPKDTQFDLLILNAYPKDTELLQAENGFIPLKSFGAQLVKEGGAVLLTSACSEGMGHHGLFAPGGKLYHVPRPLRFLKSRQFLFYSPSVKKDDFYRLFWKDYMFFNEKPKLEHFLAHTFQSKVRVGVFPYASLQLLKRIDD